MCCPALIDSGERERSEPGKWHGDRGRRSQAGALEEAGRAWAVADGQLWEAIAGKGGEVSGDSPSTLPWVKARGQLLSPRVEKFMLSEEEERKRDQELQLRTRSLGDLG